MTLWKEINEIPSSKKDLRSFGLTLGIAFGLIGGFLAWRGNGAWPYFLGISGFFFGFGLVLPAALKPFQKLWMTLALLMGWVMSRVILIVTFFLIVTPIGLILRLFGKDLLDIRRGVKKETHWSSHRTRAKEDYEDQF
jgi:hypothetical protein